MSGKNFLRALTAVVLISGLLSTVKSARALGTPQIVSVSPGSPQPVGTSVTIHATVQWDSDFRSMRICFRDENWCQEDATPDITKTFNTGGLSAGTYNIIAEVAAVNQGWDTANKTYASYELTANQPTPQPTNPPAISCSVDSFDASPRTLNIGDTIHIEGSGSCNVGVRATRVMLDGGSDIYEIGSPSLSTDWSTSGLSTGQHKLVLQVAGQGDNNWSQAANSSPIYFEVGSPNQPAPQPSCVFSASDVINIKGDIYVIDGSCTRHLVPNPETLDALGIPRSWVNNRGLSNADLKAIHQGTDVPDVNRDPSGFAAFKVQFFPNTSPITPNGQAPQDLPNVPNGGQLIPVPQGPTGSTGGCPNAPTMVKPGDIAITADFSATDNSLNIRNNPNVNADIVGQIPIGGQFTIIAGPKCKNKIRWYEVGYNGIDGWSAEVSEDGQYNYVPNGYLPGPNTSAGNPALSNNPQAQDTQPPVPQQNPGMQNFVDPNTVVPTQSEKPKGIFCTILPLFCPTEVEARAKFDQDQCTWYAAGKRPDVLIWLPDHSADAKTWDSYARQYGISVTSGISTAEKGDIVIFHPGDYPWVDSTYGHVAYVESVNVADNSIHISEYNGLKKFNYSERDVKVVPGMSFIHNTIPSPLLSPAPNESPSATPKWSFWNWLKSLFGG